MNDSGICQKQSTDFSGWCFPFGQEYGREREVVLNEIVEAADLADEEKVTPAKGTRTRDYGQVGTHIDSHTFELTDFNCPIARID